jgi:hypothetical protein
MARSENLKGPDSTGISTAAQPEILTAKAPRDTGQLLNRQGAKSAKKTRHGQIAAVLENHAVFESK